MATGKKTAEFEPKAIPSRAALLATIAEIEFLLSRPRRTKSESSRLDRLSEAVREYERRKLPVAPRSPSERLHYLLEIHETNVEELSGSTGVNESKLQGVLSGNQKLSEADSARLADHFALDADAFL